jgi:phosphoribosylaminoimidazole-succinocarboxamide synthase
MGARTAILDEPKLLFRGKVRDVYEMDTDRLLLSASDRISAFDVVLPTPIPHKGVVLTQLSAFWFEATRHLVGNHMLETNGRDMLCRRAERIDVECVARGYLAGSAWVEYQQQGTICGQPAPAGLLESAELLEPIFTPTTKVESGHDQPMTFAEVEALIGADLAARAREVTLAVYAWARAYALERGIIIADTKIELGLIDGELILIDELLTPDSSRFWPADTYAPGGPQPSFDKQFVRDYLIGTTWDKQPPAPELPAEVVAGTRERYFEAYRRLVGRELRP